MKLREYQKECLEEMKMKKEGSYLVQLATGLGKTVIFTNYINNSCGKTLILSHREELVYQPIKYLKDKVGIEKGKLKSSNERIIVSTVQTMSNRLTNFDKDANIINDGR